MARRRARRIGLPMGGTPATPWPARPGIAPLPATPSGNVTVRGTKRQGPGQLKDSFASVASRFSGALGDPDSLARAAKSFAQCRSSGSAGGPRNTLEDQPVIDVEMEEGGCSWDEEEEAEDEWSFGFGIRAPPTAGEKLLPPPPAPVPKGKANVQASASAKGASVPPPPPPPAVHPSARHTGPPIRPRPVTVAPQALAPVAATSWASGMPAAAGSDSHGAPPQPPPPAAALASGTPMPEGQPALPEHGAAAAPPPPPKATAPVASLHAAFARDGKQAARAQLEGIADSRSPPPNAKGLHRRGVGRSNVLEMLIGIREDAPPLDCRPPQDKYIAESRFPA